MNGLLSKYITGSSTEADRYKLGYLKTLEIQNKQKTTASTQKTEFDKHSMNIMMQKCTKDTKR